MKFKIGDEVILDNFHMEGYPVGKSGTIIEIGPYDTGSDSWYRLKIEGHKPMHIREFQLKSYNEVLFKKLLGIKDEI